MITFGVDRNVEFHQQFIFQPLCRQRWYNFTGSPHILLHIIYIGLQLSQEIPLCTVVCLVSESLK